MSLKYLSQTSISKTWCVWRLVCTGQVVKIKWNSCTAKSTRYPGKSLTGFAFPIVLRVNQHLQKTNLKFQSWKPTQSSYRTVQRHEWKVIEWNWTASMLTCNQRSKAQEAALGRTDTACGEGPLACISEALIEWIMNAGSSTITQHEKMLIGDVPEIWTDMTIHRT